MLVDQRLSPFSRRQLFFRVLAALAAIAFSTGCGGGGRGGGSSSVSRSVGASASFGDLSGETDPDQDGTILVEYTLYSNRSTELDIAIGFSTDGGETFSPCTEDKSATLGELPNPSDGQNGLASAPFGVSHVFAWDSDAAGDLPGQNLGCVVLRIAIQGGESALSPYFTVINDRSDASSPRIAAFSATAVENGLNDLLVVTFDEGVNAGEAADLENYRFENPLGDELAVPAGSTISYDPVDCATTIVLDGDGAASLIFGAACRVETSGVHDLVGNQIATNPDGTAQAVVDGDGAILPGDKPDLQLAVYLNSGPPEAGRVLVLVFNEDMGLDSGGVFNYLDVEFWDPGDRIGWGAQLPIEIMESQPNAVRITLGLSPLFQPGVSRINVSHENNVIGDLAGNFAYLPAVPAEDDYVTVVAMEHEPPVIDLLTVSKIPMILNGDGPAGGTLQTTRGGFDIDVVYHDEGGAGVDPDTLQIQSSVPVSYGGGALPAGTDLVPHLVVNQSDPESASFALPAGMLFPAGTAVLRATVADVLGNGSEEFSFAFQVAVPTASQLPFRTTVNPSQVWKLMLGRDLYTLGISSWEPVVVDTIAAANGESDFDEDLRLYGLNSESPFPVPGTDRTSNALIRVLITDEIVRQLSDVIYAGANIDFEVVNWANFPGNSPQVSYNSFGSSVLAIGGDSDIGALGVAFVDRCNKKQDNNKLYKGSSPYNPGTNLGIFTTRIFIYEVNGAAYGLFRLTFDPFIPCRGTPVGEGAFDEDILMDIAGTGPPVGGENAVRRDAILTAVARLARYIAVISAHEMGHSMGAAVNGAMPSGHYGGDAVHFPGSTSNHINLSSFPELFTAPNINIMSPSTNFTYTNAEGTRFNRLIQAYFREEIFYDS